MSRLQSQRSERRKEVLIASHDQAVARRDVRPVEVNDRPVDIGPDLGRSREVSLGQFSGLRLVNLLWLWTEPIRERKQ